MALNQGKSLVKNITIAEICIIVDSKERLPYMKLFKIQMNVSNCDFKKKYNNSYRQWGSKAFR